MLHHHNIIVYLGETLICKEGNDVSILYVCVDDCQRCTIILLRPHHSRGLVD